MKTEFLTPVGRLVQGDPFEPQTKNMQGQPLMTMSGQPTQRYFIAVAFRKDDQAFAALYQKLAEVARASFPTLFNAQGQCAHPRFSWKLMDGDGVDDNGKSNATKEGFAGHWVLKFSSSFAPRCFHAGHYQPHEQIQDPKAIQRGYFVRVAGSIEGNDNPQKPGLYVNLGMVELAGVGPIISSGPDASAVFGGSAPQLPAGAQPLPMNAGMPAAPTMPGMAAPAPAMPGMAAPAAAMPGFTPPGVGAAVPGYQPPTNNVAAPALPATTFPSNPVAVPPNPAFLAGPGGVAAAPAMPQMTAAAGGATYEQFRAQNWTDEQLRAQGYML